MLKLWLVMILGVLPMAAMLYTAGTATAQPTKNRPFTRDFRQEDCTFSSTGENPYFILQPGYETVFAGMESKVAVVNTITVTGETRMVDGVVTRLVEERETHDGQLAEISRNYFAVCAPTNSVFYFGEEVDLYAGGVIVGHEGSWMAGVNGARAGIVMPGTVLLGSRYFQEIAPKVAMDQAEVAAFNQVVNTPAGAFQNCVRTDETTPLEPGAFESKFYAPGIGLVKDDTLLLTHYGYVR
jgi:hypothetical protein